MILRDDPALSKHYKSGKTLLITGAVFLGVGAVAIVAGGYAFTYTLEPVVPGVIVGTGVLVAIPGAILLPMGLKRQRAARYEAGKRVAWTPTPLVFRRGGGLGLAGQF